MRYISVMDLSKKLGQMLRAGESRENASTLITWCFDEADGVEIVRCRECENFEEFKHGNGWCALHETDLVHRDDFCARGERKSDG